MTWKQTAVLKINNLLCNILLCYTGDRQKSFCQKINPLTFSQLTNPPMTFHLKQTNIVYSLNRVF